MSRSVQKSHVSQPYTPHRGKDGVRGLFQKKKVFFAMNGMKCPDLYRKVMFANLTPLIRGIDGVGVFTESFFVTNGMKCPHLHRKVMLANLPPQLRGGGN